MSTPHLTFRCGFEAARQIERAGRGINLHGHSFVLNVRARPADIPAPSTLARGRCLQAKVEDVVSELNYSLLNDRIENPDDLNIASWIAQRLAGTAHHISLQSAPEEGALLCANAPKQIWKKYHFEAAHQLPNVPEGHKCGRMHGHSFAVVLHGDAVDPFTSPEALDQAWGPLRRQLAHRCLNDIPGLENPTSEVLSRWIWEQIQRAVPQLRSVTVFETASCGSHYDGSTFRIWKDMSLDSAVCHSSAPADSPESRLHGHTYGLRLHLQAPLDTVMGWTVDFGDVKAQFAPVFADLDHHRLDQLSGLDSADTTALVQWVAERASPRLPALHRVDVFDTPGCGSLLSLNGTDPVATL